MYIGNFLTIKPPHEINQNECLNWLSTVHNLDQITQRYSQEEYLKMIQRVGCSEQQIQRRYFLVPDISRLDFENSEIYPIKKSTQGASMHHRHEFYQKTVRELFHRIYENRNFPDDLIHVSCNGYISPSAAQIEALNEPHPVTVTHSYHMGCNGAFPALRMSSGFLTNENILGTKCNNDLVHTELCSLHVNPEDPTLEQLVIQSLFADGCIAYRIRKERPEQGLKVLSIYEEMIPGTEEAMGWMVSDWGMKMTLSKDVPTMVGDRIRDFMMRWFKQGGYELAEIQRNALFAIHPGGPKIIDQVMHQLELREDQVTVSRNLLKNRGNMSSTTLPPLWQEIVNDATVPSGTPIVSFAFGPGLTFCAGLMEKL